MVTYEDLKAAARKSSKWVAPTKRWHNPVKHIIWPGHGLYSVHFFSSWLWRLLGTSIVTKIGLFCLSPLSLWAAGSIRHLLQQAPAQDHAKASDSIARGSPQDLLIKTCTRSCKDPWEDFTRISTRSSHKDFWETLTMIFMPAARRECHKIVIKGWRGSNKIEVQDPPKSIPEELLYKHLIQALKMHMDSSQGHVYASIYNEMSQSRWSTLTAPPILCELAQSNCTWTSQKAPFLREFAMKMPQTMTGTTGLRKWNTHGHLRKHHSCESLTLQWKCRRPRQGQPFCGSLRSRNAHGHLRRERLCRPKPRRTSCAGLRSRNVHGHLTRELFTVKKPEIKGRTQRTLI